MTGEAAEMVARLLTLRDLDECMNGYDCGDTSRQILLGRLNQYAAKRLACVVGLIEAALQWKCPSCGGTGVYSGYSHDAPGGQACRKCDGDGLHPRASAALRAIEQAAGAPK